MPPLGRMYMYFHFSRGKLYFSCVECLGASWSKSCWTDRKNVWFFLNQIVFGSDKNFKYQYDPFSNTKIHPQIMAGLSKMAYHRPTLYFIFGYFSTELGISVDVHEKIIT
jgi:hypothetical protein